MNIIEQIQELFKTRNFSDKTLPEIRYFDGIQSFCTPSGQYKSDTLEGSLELFLQDINH